MDWFGDRHEIRRHIRNEMIQRGLLGFCDEPDEQRDEAYQQAEVMRQCPVWELSNAAEELGKPSLVAAGIDATTTDHELQGIENTVIADSEFWSSSGSSSKGTDEGLLYALKSPACCVKFVAVAVYRAQYQHGDPLYPPQDVSFYVGPSPLQLYPASPVYPCQRNDDLQVFPLYTCAPVAGYLLVRLHGKLQKQWEDQQYYLAIRHVAAFGDALPAYQLPKVLSHINDRGLAWHTSWTPASCIMHSEDDDDDQQDHVVYDKTTEEVQHYETGRQRNKLESQQQYHARSPAAIHGSKSPSSHPLKDKDMMATDEQMSEMYIPSCVLQGPTGMELLPPIIGPTDTSARSTRRSRFLSPLGEPRFLHKENKEDTVGLQGTAQVLHANQAAQSQGQPDTVVKSRQENVAGIQNSRQDSNVRNDHDCHEGTVSSHTAICEENRMQCEMQTHPDAMADKTRGLAAGATATCSRQRNGSAQPQETAHNRSRPCMGLACSLHHGSPYASPTKAKPAAGPPCLPLFYVPELGCGSDWNSPVPQEQGCSPTGWPVYEYDVECEA